VRRLSVRAWDDPTTEIRVYDLYDEERSIGTVTLSMLDRAMERHLAGHRLAIQHESAINKAYAIAAELYDSFSISWPFGITTEYTMELPGA
jgi:hypothetical protein